VRAQRRKRQKGIALAVVLVTLLILTVMGLALGTMGILNLNQMREAEEQQVLLHTANGGLHSLMAQLKANPGLGSDQQASGTSTVATSIPGTRYWWTFNPSDPRGARFGYCTNNVSGETAVTGFNGMQVPPHTALIIVYADRVDEAQLTNPVRVAALVTNDFNYAVATDGTILLADVSGVNGLAGNVRSNAVGGDPNIELDSVTGYVFTRDPYVSDTDPIDINRTPEGSPVYNAPPVELPDIPIEDIVNSHSDAGTRAHGHTGSGDGAHEYGGPASIQVQAGSVNIDAVTPVSITINGTTYPLSGTTVDIYLEDTGDGTVTTTGSLTLPKGLNLFIKGNLRVNGSLEQLTLADPHRRPLLASRGPGGGGGGGGGGSPLPAPSASPSPSPSPSVLPGTGLTGTSTNIFATGTMRFNGGQSTSMNLFAGTGIDQNGSSTYKGIIYVRNGDFTLSGGGTNSNITGIVIVRGGELGNLSGRTVNLTYDPSVIRGLSQFGFDLNSDQPFHVLSWFMM
jgi:Tfp pilus assembly protein PilV